MFDLATLDGSNGFRIVGVDKFDGSGYSVSGAGDVNGDGFDDVIIGTYYANQSNSKAGESYVLFGKAGGHGGDIDLATLDGTNGFRLDGVDAYDLSGRSVSSAGDVNGDGFGDIIIGASEAGGHFFAGESYVVFGKADGFAASLDLATLNGTNGFRLAGAGVYDLSGRSVSSAGDVNGDGFDDVIVGAYGGDPTDAKEAGESYVVFGKAAGFAASIDLTMLDGSDGFRLDGADAFDESGRAVSSAGDINNDGFDDIVVGARSANPGGDSEAGESYVVFGKADGFEATLDLAALNGSNGFRLDGIDANDDSGSSVSSAGDVNGDGFDDIIIGARYADPDGKSLAGESYVVFGKADAFAASLDLSTLDGKNGFRIDGIHAYDQSGYSVSSAGDVNGDGFDDMIIGARFANHGGDRDAGESYVVFGKAGGHGGEINLSTLDGSNGFRIDGAGARDYSGVSVSAAGDVNGDGFDDVIVGADGSHFQGSRPGESYVVFGHAPDEAVERIGSAASQAIHGGDFDDRLSGWAGDDTLAGGAGKDELKGGGGSDEFVLASTDAGDADTIVDFGRDGDHIALDGAMFGIDEGPLAAGRFIVGDTAADADDRLIYNEVTGNLFFDADGTGAQAQVLIATLNDAPILTAADIVVI